MKYWQAWLALIVSAWLLLGLLVWALWEIVTGLLAIVAIMERTIGYG